MFSIEKIDKEQQHNDLLTIKKMVDKEWTIIINKSIDEKDKALKKKFDNIIELSLNDNWINDNYVQTYINKVKKMISDNKYDYFFPLLCYTCLVDIFKYKILKQNDFITDVISDCLCDKSVNNYKEYGKVLLDERIINIINEIESIRKENDYSVKHDCDEMIVDLNYSLPDDKILDDAMAFMNNALTQRKESYEDVIISEDTTIKEFYDIVKNDMDNLSMIAENVFNDDNYHDLKLINKINYLPLEEQKRCIRILANLYNSELDLISKVINIIYFIKIFTNNVKNDNIITCDFGRKK